jgi:hypothetical protein
MRKTPGCILWIRVSYGVRVCTCWLGWGCLECHGVVPLGHSSSAHFSPVQLGDIVHAGGVLDLVTAEQ